MNNKTAAKNLIIIVMGVSGVGKTTIGQGLAESLGWPFFDADDFHPQANVDKMARGVPLTDADRWPWLTCIHQKLSDLLAEGRSAVITCSALKAAYRERLTGTQAEQIVFVYLRGEYDLLLQRMQAREGHFMKAAMLKSQFDTLEEPTEAITVDVTVNPETIIQNIQEQLAVA